MEIYNVRKIEKTAKVLFKRALAKKKPEQKTNVWKNKKVLLFGNKYSKIKTWKKMTWYKVKKLLYEISDYERIVEKDYYNVRKIFICDKLLTIKKEVANDGNRNRWKRF